MIPCVSEAVKVALECGARKDAALAQAYQTYVDALLYGDAPKGGTAELVAVVDLLEIGPLDFRTDADCGAASQALHARHLKARDEQNASRRAILELEKQLEQMPWNDKERQRVEWRIATEERLIAQAEHTIEVLGLSGKSFAAKSPRLFPDGKASRPSVKPAWHRRSRRDAKVEPER